MDADDTPFENDENPTVAGSAYFEMKIILEHQTQTFSINSYIYNIT